MDHGYWDIHNHILPGIDDGSCCMEETYSLVEQEYRQGIRNLIFTPHYRPGMFEIRALEREKVYIDVCRKMQKEFPDMHFYLGCEYFAHNYMMANLRDVRCRMAGTNVILQEFSSVGHYRYMADVVSRILKRGYRPILAHAERYQCLYKNEERVRLLKEMGALIQVNAGSILGKSGISRKRFCHKLLDADMVDFVASDAHDPERRPVWMEACMDRVEKKYGAESVERLFWKNPQRIFKCR